MHQCNVSCPDFDVGNHGALSIGTCAAALSISSGVLAMVKNTKRK